MNPGYLADLKDQCYQLNQLDLKSPADQSDQCYQLGLLDQCYQLGQ